MPPMTRAAMLAALCLLTGAVQAQQYPETSSRGAQVRIQRDSAADRVVAKVYEGRYSFVRIESREPGADTNAQPVSLPPQALRALLAQVQIAGTKPEPLFSADQLDELAAPLSQALARADAGQDVSIAAADRFGGLGPFAPLQATTARVFHRAGRLHLIVGLLRRDVDTPMRATGVLIAFEPGQRGRQQAAGLQLALAPGQGEVLRGDWVALATSPQAVAPAPAAPAAPAAAAPAAAAPAPAAGAAPAAAAAPAPSASDALYQRMAERLRTLERLHKDGLISDAEYREKRKDILGGL